LQKQFLVYALLSEGTLVAIGYSNDRLAFLDAATAHYLDQVAPDDQEPHFVYELADIVKRVGWFRASFRRPISIRYAMKANAHPEILRTLSGMGVGADVVSTGELARALESEIAPGRIVFSGVGKSKAELQNALELGIGQINVESLAELNRLLSLARSLKKKANIGLRLNPELSVETHPFIQTGHAESKFGLPLADLPNALKMLSSHKEFVTFRGLAAHLGSQMMDIKGVVSAAMNLLKISVDLMKEGWPLSTLDMGGGLGIDYEGKDSDENLVGLYGRELERVFKDSDLELILEPGRFLVARSGVYLCRVEYIKRTPVKNFVIVNGGMNHFLRPALYRAKHRVWPLKRVQSPVQEMFDVVGPICESTDVLRAMYMMPPPSEGDWLAILDAGAYGASMSSQYNLRPLANEYIIRSP
jgi:diaminopimelate decarboxylase